MRPFLMARFCRYLPLMCSLSERDHVADSRGCVPQQQDHGARSEPLVTATTDKVARRDHTLDLFLRKGLDIVGLQQVRTLQGLCWVLPGPFALDTESKELPQNLDFLDPGPVNLVPPYCVAVHGLDRDLVYEPD